MKIFVLLDEGNVVQGWGTTSHRLDNEVVLEIDETHPILTSLPSLFVYENGEIVMSSELELDRKRALKMRELNESCEHTIFGRFVATVRGIQYQFSNDVEAQMNFDKSDRAFDKGRITEVTWTCYDMQGNVQRLVMDATDFEVVYVAHLQHITGNIARFRDELAPLVHQAQSVEDLGKIKWEEDTPTSDTSSLK